MGLAIHAAAEFDLPMHGELFAMEAALVGSIALLSLDTVRHLYRSVVQSMTVRHDLTYLAKSDALTGLPNRLRLRERFDQSLVGVSGSGLHLAIHFLDLDGFKAINDLHGHLAGDAVLQEVSRRLVGMVRSEDTVARLGGDEFVVLQAPIGHRGEAELLARRIIKNLSAPYAIEGKRMCISVSVGIAVAPDQGWNFDSLAACADAALYRSKGGGKGQLRFCTAEEAAGAITKVA